jgi:hypothetical protein
MQKENDAELKTLDAAVDDAVRLKNEQNSKKKKQTVFFSCFSKPTLAIAKCAKHC